MADGVVHFRVRAFDTNGYEIVANNNNRLAFPTNHQANYNYNQGLMPITNSFGSWNSINLQSDYYFLSNAVPASLELEIGFLEPHLVDRWRAMAAGLTAVTPALQNAQKQYLSNHVANVHIFRQRIPIRNVDYSAYQ